MQLNYKKHEFKLVNYCQTDRRFTHRYISEIALHDNLKTKQGYRHKRTLDLFILLVAHILGAPLWAFLWIVIPLAIFITDGSPIFYRQLRAGKNNKNFVLLKFRTMILDADLLGPSWTLASDERVTPIGRLLRRTAMDELPGLLSIWKGDMSLVGPRALDVEEQSLLEERIPGFADRLQVRPGLTGLAQVYDKLDIATDKLKYDLEYIDRMNLLLDSSLIFLSIRNSMLGRWDRRTGKDNSDTE